ncbi:glucosamine inositolphosphorylceramide transferase family protein [Eudoraea chungangensis]|uniref:glucosamine inositolphosphorylceramide transferase family protein n=1 Tax=Eudoraea chungangensis TaxID=1481905 RepID=UPI0023EBAB6F|nr:hypothetical protein [Eudoraea chungangensis]
MKIGIWVNSLKGLENWQVRIVQSIIADPNLTLSLVIEEKNSKERRIKNTKKENNWFNSLIKFLFQLQIFIERKILFKKPQSADKSLVLSYANEVPSLLIHPSILDEVVILKDGEEIRIQSYYLDIILHLEVCIYNFNLVGITKYGLWSILTNCNYKGHNDMAGLWEICNKKSVIEVGLVQFGVKNNAYEIVETAFFNPHWSLARTNDILLEGSVTLWTKNLRKLSGRINIKKSLPSIHTPSDSCLHYSYLVKYLFFFYITLYDKAWKIITGILFGIRYQHWILFFGKGNFLNSDLKELKPIIPPKNEFWADPFLFMYKGITYVFYETYEYHTKKGKISCGVLEDGDITNVVDVLNLDYHLSYPYIFEEDGEIYLMPETLENMRLEVYRCVQFPNKWELISTAFEGEMVADAFFYNDKMNQNWLFINKKKTDYLPINSELYIYKTDGPKLNVLLPHTENPVYIDSRVARNGGGIFRYKNDIFRPSQRNIDGVYGKALNINKIHELTIDSFIEERAIVFEPDFQKGLMSVHHLHQIEDYFVIDAAFQKWK